MNQQTKSIPWINNVKALSIIAVFFVHCQLYYGFTLDGANLFINPWYVNAFFFVSGYLLFLVIYLRIARFRGINRYRKSRKVIEHMRRDWRRLEELYEEEERRKSPKLKEVFNEKIFDEESAFGEPSGE